MTFTAARYFAFSVADSDGYVGEVYLEVDHVDARYLSIEGSAGSVDIERITVEPHLRGLHGLVQSTPPSDENVILEFDGLAIDTGLTLTGGGGGTA